MSRDGYWTRYRLSAIRLSSGYRLSAVCVAGEAAGRCFTYELPQLPHLLVMLPGLGRLVVDLLELLEDVLDYRRRPYARLGLQERRRPQNVLKHLWYHGTARERCIVGWLRVRARMWLTRT